VHNVVRTSNQGLQGSAVSQFGVTTSTGAPTARTARCARAAQACYIHAAAKKLFDDMAPDETCAACDDRSDGSISLLSLVDFRRLLKYIKFCNLFNGVCRGRAPAPTHHDRSERDLFEKCTSFTRADETKARGVYPYFHPIEESEGPSLRLRAEDRYGRIEQLPGSHG